MSAFEFKPLRRPFPRWMGPFSPARGVHSGFRFHDGRLGTWVSETFGRSFWALRDSPGCQRLSDLVRSEWRGGRVLFLPNGHVLKPLQRDTDVGRRALIGSFRGALVLERPDGTVFDLDRPGSSPGGLWSGPSTTGLECAIQPDGALRCNWYHPSRLGRDELAVALRGPDAALAKGFRRCRPSDSGGRVRVTANGHVITNRKAGEDSWVTLYVGRIDRESWSPWDQWIGKERA